MLTQLGYGVSLGGTRNTEKGRIIENPNASKYLVADAADFATKIGRTCSMQDYS